MTRSPKFLKAFPYQDNVLALPVADISVAAEWYCRHFGMTEVKRAAEPIPTVVLERDGTQIGFAENSGDPAQDGAAILVSEINSLKSEFEAAGLKISETRTDERDGKLFTVFFVVAPDGLCYYFHEPQSEE